MVRAYTSIECLEKLIDATGIWKPTKSSTVKEAVVFGQNGFYLPFTSDRDNAIFLDSMNNLAQPWGNVHTDTAEKKFGTASAQFDGTGDYLTIPKDAAWNIFENTYNPATTIDFWVKHTSRILVLKPMANTAY